MAPCRLRNSGRDFIGMDMKKIVIHQAGSYDQLKIEEHGELRAGQGQIIVQVQAIGVNYADCLVRWGVYESAKEYIGWPITPGFEFAGVIKELGPDCQNLRVGQEVMGVTLFNAYATEVCVSENQIFPLPQGFSKLEAAGFPAVFFTAYHALFQIVRLYPHSKILVHSAAGGVGSALTQLAHAAGFKVTGVVGGSHKIEAVKKLGADFVIDKSQEDLWKKAREICPEGYDAIFDANGYVTLREGYRHLRPTGKLISYGAHSLLPKGGTGRLNYFKAAWGLLRTPKFNPLQLITDNKSVVGFNLSFLFQRSDLLQESISELLKLASAGKIKPPTTTSFPFADVAKAHQLLESGQSVGKIVLTV